MRLAGQYSQGMAIPSFLFQDSSWRTVSIPWGNEYNRQLKSVMGEALPDAGTPVRLPDLSRYREANANGLVLLDSREITAQGKLPRHICGYAFEPWLRTETEVQERGERLASVPQETDESIVETLCLYALSRIVKFNLANLSLIDETTPPFMNTMAHQSISGVLDSLHAVTELEPRVEDLLGGLPSPTRQVRDAIEYAIHGRTPSPVERFLS